MTNKFPLIMKAAAGLSMALTLGLTILAYLHPQTWSLAAAISVGVTAYHLNMRLLVGFFVPAVTGYQFDYRRFWFQPRSWEPALYRFLHLRRWKKFLPTYDPSQWALSQNTLRQIICNTCGAEIVHEIIMVLSFCPMVLIPVFGEPTVFLITSVLSSLFDSIFVMAQRYNRPRLVRIFEKQEATKL